MMKQRASHEGAAWRSAAVAGALLGLAVLAPIVPEAVAQEESEASCRDRWPPGFDSERDR